MLSIIKKILHEIGDFVLLNNIKLRENNSFKDQKHIVNNAVKKLVLTNTIVYASVILSYFFIKNKDNLYYVFVNSTAVLYGVFYLMVILYLVNSRNTDHLRYPCNRAECSIGIVNYHKRITNLVKASKYINMFSIILLVVALIVI